MCAVVGLTLGFDLMGYIYRREVEGQEYVGVKFSVS